MVKRGKLNRVELYYIEGNSNLTVEEIAKELDRSVPLVKKALENIGVIEAAPVEEPVENKKPESAMAKAMGRHERNGQPVCAVMTKAASELADATRPARMVNKKIQEAIHKPRG